MNFLFKAAQVKRSKEGQVDLVSPDSILTKINCRVSKHTFIILQLHAISPIVLAWRGLSCFIFWILIVDVDGRTKKRQNFSWLNAVFDKLFLNSTVEKDLPSAFWRMVRFQNIPRSRKYRCLQFQTLINFRTFNLLPKHYQYQLVKLLPEVDREVGSKGEIK